MEPKNLKNRIFRKCRIPRSGLAQLEIALLWGMRGTGTCRKNTKESLIMTLEYWFYNSRFRHRYIFRGPSDQIGETVSYKTNTLEFLKKSCIWFSVIIWNLPYFRCCGVNCPHSLINLAFLYYESIAAALPALVDYLDVAIMLRTAPYFFVLL